MPVKSFNDVHFATENGESVNCTRVIWDNDDGSTSYDNLKIYRFGDRGKGSEGLQARDHRPHRVLDEQVLAALHRRTHHQDRLANAGFSKQDALFHQRHGEAVDRVVRRQTLRDLSGPVPVGIGLDHRKDPAAGGLGQDPSIVGHRAQIDLDVGRSN